MMAVLIRIFLVIHVMKIAHGLPMFLVFSKMVCHCPHGRADGYCVGKEMVFRRMFCQDFFGSCQCQFAHINSSICKSLYYLL